MWRTIQYSSPTEEKGRESSSVREQNWKAMDEYWEVRPVGSQPKLSVLPEFKFIKLSPIPTHSPSPACRSRPPQARSVRTRLSAGKRREVIRGSNLPLHPQTSNYPRYSCPFFRLRTMEKRDRYEGHRRISGKDMEGERCTHVRS